MAGPLETFGIVLTGQNCGTDIAPTLEALKEFHLPLVFVDMSSIDDTVDVVRSQKVDCLELPIDRPVCRARACNEGAAHLLNKYPKLELVQFLRVGCYLDPNWPTVATKLFARDTKLAALAGFSYAKNKKGKDRMLYVDLAKGYLGDLNGGDFVVRLSALKELHGFDVQPRLGFETEFVMRLHANRMMARRVPVRMLAIDAEHYDRLLHIRPSFRQGYIQYYLIFKGPTLPSRIKVLCRSLWVTLWTFWLPIGIGLGWYWEQPKVFFALLAYPILILGFFLRRRLRIKKYESYFTSIAHSFRTVAGFWARLMGQWMSFSDLYNAETEKIFSKKKKL